MIHQPRGVPEGVKVPVMVQVCAEEVHELFFVYVFCEFESAFAIIAGKGEQVDLQVTTGVNDFIVPRLVFSKIKIAFRMSNDGLVTTNLQVEEFFFQAQGRADKRKLYQHQIIFNTSQRSFCADEVIKMFVHVIFCRSIQFNLHMMLLQHFSAFFQSIANGAVVVFEHIPKDMWRSNQLAVTQVFQSLNQFKRGFRIGRTIVNTGQDMRMDIWFQYTQIILCYLPSSEYAKPRRLGFICCSQGFMNIVPEMLYTPFVVLHPD